MKPRLLFTVFAAVGLFWLAGCAPQPTLYHWGDYEDQVYDYLRSPEGGDLTAQIQVLEADVEKAKAQNKPLPPGFRAHLGMLYYARGKVDQAVEQFQLEKAAFPESTPFMDRLLNKFKG